MSFFTVLTNAVTSVATPPSSGSGVAVAAGGAIGTYLAHFWGYVPGVVAVIAGIMAILSYGVGLYESAPIKAWRIRRAQTRKLRRIARLKAKEKVIIAQLEALELKRTAAVAAGELMRSAEQAATERVAAAAAAAKVEKVHAETEAAVPDDKGGQDG